MHACANIPTSVCSTAPLDFSALLLCRALISSIFLLNSATPKVYIAANPLSIIWTNIEPYVKQKLWMHKFYFLFYSFWFFLSLSPRPNSLCPSRNSNEIKWPLHLHALTEYCMCRVCFLKAQRGLPLSLIDIKQPSDMQIERQGKNRSTGFVWMWAKVFWGSRPHAHRRSDHFCEEVWVGTRLKMARVSVFPIK